MLALCDAEFAARWRRSVQARGVSSIGGRPACCLVQSETSSDGVGRRAGRSAAKNASREGFPRRVNGLKPANRTA